MRKESFLIPGGKEQPISISASLPDKGDALPVVIFAHGFKGFKNWGAFPLMAKPFTEAGFAFIAFDFSHNGVLPENSSDITSPELFGKNTFSLELAELRLLLDWLTSSEIVSSLGVDSSKIYFLGHSLGGALGLLTSANDSRLQKIVTWAAPANILKYADLEEENAWKERGFTEIVNSRTGQVYPLSYAFREDIIANQNAFNLIVQLDKLSKPVMFVHALNDEIVSIHDARLMANQIDHSILLEFEAGGHTLGSKHPWTSQELPGIMEEAIDETIEFFLL